MGQSLLTLADLHALGRATVRAIDWWTATTPEAVQDIGRFADDVTAAGGNAYAAVIVPPGDLLLGYASYSDGGNWSVDLWTTQEWQGEQSAAWYLEVRYPHEPHLGVRLVMRLAVGHPLTVAVESDRRVGQEGLQNTPKFVRWVRQNVPSIPDFRRVARSIDGYSRHIAVTINPSWAAQRIMESVMAQIAEWCVRVEEFPHSRFPGLDADVYEWWADWATRLSRRGHGEPVSSSDVFEIARKSVRTPTSAGHHLYWKKWLVERRGGLMETAAKEVGIGRRTGFERLRKAGKRLSDFSGCANPLRELILLLRASQPPRSLPPERKEIVKGLVEAGIKPATARKLERRLRDLAQDEQARRLHNVLARAASMRD